MEHGTSCDRLGFELRFPQQISRHDLVAAIQRGDKGAFQQLIATYEEIVLRFALNVTGSGRVAQEVYCQVFRDLFLVLSKRGPQTSLFLLVHRILVKRCIAVLRQNKTSRAFAKSKEHSRRSNLENTMTHGIPESRTPFASQATVQNLLESLSPEERIVLQLKQYHGLRLQTLADILDTTPASISKTLRNAIAHLRTACQDNVPATSPGRPPHGQLKGTDEESDSVVG